jgi:predicted dehydrogenase
VLVKDPDNIRLAMLGMVEGNGHPYSWSAIINGDYDAEVMADCGYPVIPVYLGAQPREQLGIPGCAVTHIWCDDPADARRVARATMIPNVVDRPEDVIGHVDAVVIPTDIGGEHLDRCMPFIEAGIPVFIDKPLTDRADHLHRFVQLHQQNAAIMSTSCMRYASEFKALRADLDSVGDVRFVLATTPKSLERYGIHALESVYQLLPAGGWQSVANTGSRDSNVVHIHHEQAEVVLAVVNDMYGAFGCVDVLGTQGRLGTVFKDTFQAFKSQLVAFVEYLRSGIAPFPFSETVEQISIIVAAIRSRDEGGRVVRLTEIIDTGDIC